MDVKRQHVDDFARRNTNQNSYKNRYFEGKRISVDEYTGENIYYSSNNYFTTKTTSNIDHIVPIDQLIKRYGQDIDKSALKDIANSDYNLAATSEALNKAKSNLSNHEYLLRQLKNGNPEDFATTYNMISKEISSEAAIRAEVTSIKVSQQMNKISKGTINFDYGKSIGKAVDAGTSSALIALTVSACNNLAMVAAGEKSTKDALKDVANDTSKSFISTGGLSLAKDGFAEICKKCGAKDIGKFLGKELPVAEITMAVMVSDSVISFLSGEMSEEECATEILLNGAGILAFKVGAMCGGPAGAVIASIVVSQISATVLKYQQEQKITKKRMAKFNRIVSDALIALEKQKNILNKLREEENLKISRAFDIGLEYIQISALQNDIDGITKGLNCVLSIFNEKCTFQTIDEFNKFFDDENATLVL